MVMFISHLTFQGSQGGLINRMTFKCQDGQCGTKAIQGSHTNFAGVIPPGSSSQAERGESGVTLN